MHHLTNNIFCGIMTICSCAIINEKKYTVVLTQGRIYEKYYENNLSVACNVYDNGQLELLLEYAGK